MANTPTISNTTVPFCGYSTKDGLTEDEAKKRNAESSKTVARIIMEQLGGGPALALMLGAKDWASHSDEGQGALSFKFKGSRKVNYVKIILTAGDDYSLRFGKIGRFDYEVVEFVEGVYAENLTEVFRRVTDLETRVPRIKGINA